MFSWFWGWNLFFMVLLIIIEVALRRFTIVFTILLSLSESCFYPTHISTPKGAYNACCHYRSKALLTHSHRVLSGTHFYGWVNQSPHDSIAAHGASNPRPFGYDSYALSNCAITAREISNQSINQSIYFENIHFVYSVIIVNPPLPEKTHQYTSTKTTCHKIIYQYKSHITANILILKIDNNIAKWN